MAIVGTSGPDNLQIPSSSDPNSLPLLLQGLEGNDTLEASPGLPWDSLEGGLGDDRLVGRSETLADYGHARGPIRVDISLSTPQGVGGGEGVDTLVNIGGAAGGAYGDTLFASGDGQVRFFGRGGDDSLHGSSYSDYLQGGDGNDTIDASVNNMLSGDTVFGDDGDDLVLGGPRTRVWAGAGNDSVVNATYVEAGDGNDTVSGSATSSDQYGLWGGAGDDSLTGSAGNDVLNGGSGRNVLAGLDGDDRFRFYDVNTETIADVDNGYASKLAQAPDSGMGGDNTIDGGAGHDVVEFIFPYYAPAEYSPYSRAPLTIDLAAGTARSEAFTPANGGATQAVHQSTLISIEGVRGGDGNDSIAGNSDNNDLWGEFGADTISGRSGDDSISAVGGEDGPESDSNYLRGDEGNDIISGSGGFDDINGNMGNDTANGLGGDDWTVGGKDNDSLSGDDGNDIVYGNLGDDTCAGGNGDDLVRGGQQNDSLTGGGGNDWLSGDRDNDTITGGAGADTFHSFGDAGLDRVTDFNRAEGDRVQLDPGSTYTVAQTGADVVISIGGGAQMILVGVQMSSLTGDWIFAA